MFEMQGAHGKARVFATETDETTYAQIMSMLNNPAFAGMDIAIQADCHAGAGSVIGFTGKIVDKVIPNLVGVDIGCGMLACRIPWHSVEKTKNLQGLDAHIHMNIPSGFRGHSNEDNLEFLKVVETEELTEAKSNLIAKIPTDSYWAKVGTLGGGNHFIELSKNSDKDLWLIIHSGSRNFGLQVAKWHQDRARKKNPGFKDQEFLFMDDGGADYLADMFKAQRYAHINRMVMLRIILRYFGVPIDSCEVIESVHNYIDPKDQIVRKGAISAYEGQKVVIPMNMAFGTVIGAGKGSAVHNWSAPHGAGRVMGRNVAKRTLKMDDFKAAMKDVFSTTVTEATLDEAPMAYKDPEKILSVLGETVEVEGILKPIYNFKDATRAMG